MLEKKKKKTIKQRVERFSVHANAIYWSAILNIICFFVLLIDKNRTYSFGYAINIFIHGVLINSTLDIIWVYLLSFLSALILSLCFFILALQVKKGKLIPLIIAFCIYFIDVIFLLCLPKNYILLTEKTNSYSIITPYLVHVVIIGYYIYLLISYKNIVSDSKISQ